MKVKYVSEKNLYVVTNQTVSKTGIFNDAYYCDRFLKQVYKYISPICELVEFSVHNHEFILLLKMKDRKCFEEYFISKKGQDANQEGEFEIPQSTYIFSQAMANLQSSMAIHFNRKEDRTGALFARRFSKIKISSVDDLEIWRGKIRKMKRIHLYTKRWSDKMSLQKTKEVWYTSSRVFLNFYRNIKVKLNEYLFWILSQLQGHLNNNLLATDLPPQTKPSHSYKPPI